MKIIGIQTSPRHGQTTYKSLNRALLAASEYSKEIETELIDLSRLEIKHCNSCDKCRGAFECSIEDDFVENVALKLKDENLKGLIVASPVYFGSMSGLCKTFFDRAVILRRNGFLLRNVVGGALSVGRARNGGQEFTLSAMHAAMFCQDMIVVADGKPTAHFGAALVSGTEGGIENDDTGMETAEGLGRRVSEIALRLN